MKRIQINNFCNRTESQNQNEIFKVKFSKIRQTECCVLQRRKAKLCELIKHNEKVTVNNKLLKYKFENNLDHMLYPTIYSETLQNNY